MKLYFLRHAAALDGEDDAVRPLSDTGKRQSRKIGRFLRRGKIVFDHAYSSPLLRARQTAEIVLGITNENQRLEPQFAGALLNSTSRTDFAEWLKSFPDSAEVLLVGHEPSIGDHVRRLLGLVGASSLDMKKGTCAAIQTTDCNSGVLRFLVTPRSLGI